MKLGGVEAVRLRWFPGDLPTERKRYPNIDLINRCKPIEALEQILLDRSVGVSPTLTPSGAGLRVERRLCSDLMCFATTEPKALQHGVSDIGKPNLTQAMVAAGAAPRADLMFQPT